MANGEVEAEKIEDITDWFRAQFSSVFRNAQISNQNVAIASCLELSIFNRETTKKLEGVPDDIGPETLLPYSSNTSSQRFQYLINVW